MTERLASALQSRSYLVRVVDKRFSRSASDVGSVRLGKILAIPSLAIRAWRSARRSDITIYFLTDRPASLLVDLVCLAVIRTPVIHYLHTSGFSSLAERGFGWRRLVRSALARSDVIVTLGEALRPAVAALAPGAQTTCIANAAPEATSVSYPTNTARVLFFSNLIPEKGVDTFLALAARLHQKYPEIPWEFHIAGAGELLKPWPVGVRVVAHGAIDSTARSRLFSESSVLVFPSRYRLEAQPLSIIEAMAAGLPVVAFDVGGVSDLYPVGSELLRAVGDEDGLELAVHRLTTDTEFRAEQSRLAAQRFATNHRLSTFSESWDRLIRGQLSN